MSRDTVRTGLGYFRRGYPDTHTHKFPATNAIADESIQTLLLCVDANQPDVIRTSALCSRHRDHLHTDVSYINAPRTRFHIEASVWTCSLSLSHSLNTPATQHAQNGQPERNRVRGAADDPSIYTTVHSATPSTAVSDEQEQLGAARRGDRVPAEARGTHVFL